MNTRNFDLIIAAVNGDVAVHKKIKHYQPMIEKESGDNPLIRRHIMRGLRETILHYNLEDSAENKKYLQTKYPSQD